MINGVGVDIVEIKRLKRAINRWDDAFLNRVFTKRELDYSHSKKFPYQHLAGRFAAKEAVFKALGNSILDFKDIEIINDKQGKPSCRLKHRIKGLKDKDIFISISHGKEYAVAQAVVEKKS
jgi:holo-[acyl-carrier protein] synthase